MLFGLQHSWWRLNHYCIQQSCWQQSPLQHCRGHSNGIVDIYIGVFRVQWEWIPDPWWCWVTQEASIDTQHSRSHAHRFVLSHVGISCRWDNDVLGAAGQSDIHSHKSSLTEAGIETLSLTISTPMMLSTLESECVGLPSCRCMPVTITSEVFYSGLYVYGAWWFLILARDRINWHSNFEISSSHDAPNVELRVVLHTILEYGTDRIGRGTWGTPVL